MTEILIAVLIEFQETRVFCEMVDLDKKRAQVEK